MKICVCGGGNLGHVAAGFLSTRKDCEVSVLTRHPEQWSNTLLIDLPDNTTLEGHLCAVSSSPKDVISGADMVLLCLPGYSIAQELKAIKTYLGTSTIVGSIVSSTGFFFEAEKILSPTQPLMGFQRTPFIARTEEYGKRASLLGFKSALLLCITRCNDKEMWRATIEKLFNTPTALTENVYEVSLTNSNPLLHPSRLYTMWKDFRDGDSYPKQSLFYEEWTEDAADIYIRMDEEFQHLLLTLGVKKGSVPDVLTYYESHDAASLAAKLRSINAFKGIKSPMKKTENGYVPDFQSRYFTEDFPYGLCIIHRLAKENHIATPTIDVVYDWGMSHINIKKSNYGR